MNEDLKKIGLMFREKREEMNLTLKEIENATSIRMLYLQSIEEGKVGQFLSAVYAMGFIKQYATFLGLNAEKLIQDNPQAFKMPKGKQEFAYGIGTLERRNSPASPGRIMPNMVWGGAAILILVAAWYFARFLGLF